MKAIYVFGVALVNMIFVSTFASAQSSPLFAVKAASFSRFEVDASKLALEKAQHDATKMFASDVLREHKSALEDLVEAAEKDKAPIPTTLDAEYGQKLDALRTASEGKFDQAYLSTQVSVHEEAKLMFESYINSGSAGSLLAYAENWLGTVRTYNLRVHGITSP
ncbi:DUF4142 domain-containing protein [Agrobacterium rosae]